MNFQRFGSIKVLRPSAEIVALAAAERSNFLKQNFRRGVYKGHQASAILNRIYAYEESIVRQTLIPVVASRNALDFVLFQYEHSALEKTGLFINGEISAAGEWPHIAPVFRRSLKFMAELFCLQRPGNSPLVDKSLSGFAMEELLHRVETMVDLYEKSHRAHYIFSDDSEVAVFRDNHNQYHFQARITGKYSGYDIHYFKRVDRDAQHRDELLGSVPWEFQIRLHQPVLDPVFEKEFGYTYGQAIKFLRHIIENCRAAAHGFPTLFLRQSMLEEQAAAIGLSQAQIVQIIDAFLIKPEALEKEERTLWKPKQKASLMAKRISAISSRNRPTSGFFPSDCYRMHGVHGCRDSVSENP
jgi:hypothetical protein